MYCYKLNNSYMGYVYFNAYKKTKKYDTVEKKISSKTSSAKKKEYYKSLDKSRCNQLPKKPTRKPLPNGSEVKHNKFGVGTIFATNENASMFWQSGNCCEKKCIVCGQELDGGKGRGGETE